MSVITERLRSQLLSGAPAADPLAVVSHLLAVQAQDPRGARLAIRARTRGLIAAAVDRALTEERSLVVSWLCRGTLHLVRAEDHAWLHALTTPQLHTAVRRRLAQEGVDEDAAERGVTAIRHALDVHGPLTRDQLAVHVGAAGVPTRGQALVHLLAIASLRGLILRGPMAGARQAFVLVRDWLGEPPAVERDAALAELARRYLAGHGPASERDLAKWAGVTLADARRGLHAVASEIDEREDGLVDLRGRGRDEGDLPPPRLLGAYDPVLHGWVSRRPVLGEHDAAVVSGGLFRPFALIDGRGAAVWRLESGGVVLTPFRRLDEGETTALAADADDVLRYLGRAPRAPSVRGAGDAG